jgi:aconitase B
MTVKKSISLLAAVGLMLAIAGCTTPTAQVAQKGDLLAAAGFQVRVADSPHRVDQMKRLPPNKFVTRVRNGQKVYLYSDPLACNCVYLGTQQNWDGYQQQLAARQMAKEEEISAAESQAEWDFGAWGW